MSEYCQCMSQELLTGCGIVSNECLKCVRMQKRARITEDEVSEMFEEMPEECHNMSEEHHKECHKSLERVLKES